MARLDFFRLQTHRCTTDNPRQMKIDPTAFELYRRSPNRKTTLLRLIIGVLIIVAAWLIVTFALLFGGAYAFTLLDQGTLTFNQGGVLERFMGSQVGVAVTLATFSGIWIGVWIAMRFVHAEPLNHLFGNSRRLLRRGFAKGLLAVLLTSALTEIGLYVMVPEIGRGPISLPVWLLFVVPVLLLAFVQISSEEILFRGYLMRGLAHRFRSPWVWAVLPTLAFTSLHWNASSPPAMSIAVIISIGGFAVLLALLVYMTGNLGAAMGAHLGNNVVGFLLISHESTLGSLALFRSPPLDSLAWTASQAVAVTAMSLASVALTTLLLLHPRSPLKVEPDLGDDPASPSQP